MARFQGEASITSTRGYRRVRPRAAGLRTRRQRRVAPTHPFRDVPQDVPDPSDCDDTGTSMDLEEDSQRATFLVSRCPETSSPEQHTRPELQDDS